MKPETERLSYERITKHHAVELCGELCDPRVYEHIDERKAPTPDELMQSFVRKAVGAPSHRNAETWMDFAVRLKTIGKTIWRVEATVLETRAEVAYLFGYRHGALGMLERLFSGFKGCWRKNMQYTISGPR